MVRVLGLVALAAIAGCSRGQSTQEKISALGMADIDSPSQQQIEMVEGAERSIKLFLKDPASAQFEKVIVSITKNCVTGHLNAKNEFGGYTGFKIFVVNDNDVTIGDVESSDKSIACINARTEEIKRGG